MPSTTSSSVSKDFASSTVMTPSLPTFFIASARNCPISASPSAEIVPTCAISWLDVTFFEFFSKSATTAATARSTPRNIRSRASTENFTSLAAILLLHGCTCDLCGLLAGGRLIEHAHDVALLHDEVIDAVELDLGAGPFSKQHAVASLQVDRKQLAVLVAATRADRDDLAFGGLLLRGIWNDDPACAL